MVIDRWSLQSSARYFLTAPALFLPASWNKPSVKSAQQSPSTVFGTTADSFWFSLTALVSSFSSTWRRLFSVEKETKEPDILFKMCWSSNQSQKTEYGWHWSGDPMYERVCCSCWFLSISTLSTFLPSVMTQIYCSIKLEWIFCWPLGGSRTSCKHSYDISPHRLDMVHIVAYLHIQQSCFYTPDDRLLRLGGAPLYLMFFN